MAKAWLSFIPYLALVGAVTVLARSTAAGMAIGRGYNFGEQIIVGLLGTVFDWFGDGAQYLPVHRISAWVGASELAAPVRPAWRCGKTALVLLGYSFAFGAMTFWLFYRKDITGAAGG